MKKILFLSALLCVGLSSAELVRSSVSAYATGYSTHDSNLPDGITAVEFIETSDDRCDYIDTGVIPEKSWAYEIRAMVTGNYTYQYLFGCQKNVHYTSMSGFCVPLRTWSSFYFTLFYENQNVGAIKYGNMLGKIFDIALSPYEFKVDVEGHTYTMEPSREMSREPEANLCLFVHNDIQPSGTYYTVGRIYRFRAFDGEGNIVIDYQPVRFTNEFGYEEGAMYDFVSGELFRNQGTGNFIIGPDL